MRLRKRRTEDLEAGNKIVGDGGWWKQELKVIAAQMARHFTIKKIGELCAMAVDLRKAAQAQTPERGDNARKTTDKGVMTP